MQARIVRRYSQGQSNPLRRCALRAFQARDIVKTRSNLLSPVLPRYRGRFSRARGPDFVRDIARLAAEPMRRDCVITELEVVWWKNLVID